jgi:hypothetical protein
MLMTDGDCGCWLDRCGMGRIRAQRPKLRSQFSVQLGQKIRKKNNPGNEVQSSDANFMKIGSGTSGTNEITQKKKKTRCKISKKSGNHRKKM